MVVEPHKVKSMDKIYSKVLENDFDVSYDEFVQYLRLIFKLMTARWRYQIILFLANQSLSFKIENHESNLQEKGFLEIGKSENKNHKSSSKLKADLIYSTKSVEKAKSKRSKSKQKSNQIEARFSFLFKKSRSRTEPKISGPTNLSGPVRIFGPVRAPMTRIYLNSIERHLGVKLMLVTKCGDDKFWMLVISHSS